MHLRLVHMSGKTGLFFKDDAKLVVNVFSRFSLRTAELFFIALIVVTL